MLFLPADLVDFSNFDFDFRQAIIKSLKTN